ncbi:MAG: tannase/feruloyl esterase family alpha/beta hydrolase [Acidobacteriota bacterium]|nr:tannase/feruloyl esterase family alpha/beta hydrolase [Acidobacteriota bacterium]
MFRRATFAIFAFSAVLISLTTAGISRAQAPAESCASLTNLRIPETTIATSDAVAAKPKPSTPPAGPAFATDLVDVAMPSYCLASGEIDQHSGPDGKSYGIGFALALPDEWNGRFLFQGGGGLDGVVRPPLGTQAAGRVPALARGFAVVSMDSGHKGSMFDASFNRDQQSSLDFAYVALGRVTTVAKEIIAKYYGEPAKHSYFVGCSTGGRQAMLASQRYPLQFDGIVAGDPAMRTGYSRIANAWDAALFNKIAPKNTQGLPVPGQAFSDSDKQLLTNSILDACDAKDGLKDGLIFDFRACHYNPEVLTCQGAKADSCLLSAQVQALQAAFAGPRDSRGFDPYVGRPYDAGVAIYLPGTFGSVLPRSAPGMFGRPNLATSVDVDALERQEADDPAESLTDTTWTNLSTFAAHGGKLIFFHGLSDPVFSPYDTLRYYNEMAGENGGADQVRNWSRIFLIPGMNHCAGGPALDRFDALGAVVKWVEGGEAPDSIVATGKYFPGRSRPLCAYPKHAQYKGSGDPQDAANFTCAD